MVTLTDEEALRVESIAMDGDKEAALDFLIKVLRPKLKRGLARGLDASKGMG